MDQVQQLIISKLDRIDQKLDRYQERLTAVETKTNPLLDNGQPGRITKIEDRVEHLEQVRWKAAGWAGSVLVALEMVFHLFWHKLVGK